MFKVKIVWHDSVPEVAACYPLVIRTRLIKKKSMLSKDDFFPHFEPQKDLSNLKGANRGELSSAPNVA